MGIKNLIALIKTHAPASLQPATLSNFSQKTIAIDSYITFYASSIATNFSSSSKILQDFSGTPTAHLIQILNSTILYKFHKIHPIWVFDGTPPELKGKELEKRKNLKILNTQLLENATLETDKQKFGARAWRLTDKMIEDSQELLRLLGQDTLVAENEAEAQCAGLAKSGLADLVFSQDSDALVFGAPFVVKGGKELVLIELEKVLQGLGIDMEQFIDLGILLGCDFGPGIKGIGKVKALEFIKKFGRIEKICEVIKSDFRGKFEVPEKFEFEKIRAFFKQPLGGANGIVKSCLDLDELRNFLTRKAFSEKGIANYLKKLSLP